MAYAALGDLTAEQLRAVASIQRELGADVRLTNRQNVVFRNLTESSLPVLYERLEAAHIGSSVLSARSCWCDGSCSATG